MEELTYPRVRALRSPETMASVIHAIILERYGEQAYEWDPSTIFLETQSDWNADMCPEAVDRWCAIQVIMTSDSFFKRLDAFLSICNTISDGEPFFGAFNPVTTEEMAWAIAEVALNREMLPFSYAIKKYMKTVLAQDGYDESSYPAIFEEVFGKQVDAEHIRHGLAVLNNDDNISQYLSEQMKDMVFQFSEIPDLKGMEKIITQRGLEEALAEQTQQQGGP
jgi:hypothetical protein